MKENTSYWSKETRDKISKTLTGRKHTLERKKNQSIAAKKRWEAGLGSGFKKGNKINVGKKLSLKTKQKIARSNGGSRNYNWKGGVTPIYKQIRKSLEYKLWRISVFERDKYSCIWCGSKTELQADHIKPFAYYPELRFAIDNGRTLCIDCHRKTETFGWQTYNKRKEYD